MTFCTFDLILDQTVSMFFCSVTVDKVWFITLIFTVSHWLFNITQTRVLRFVPTVSGFVHSYLT